MEDDKAALSRKLIDMVGEISAISEYRSTVKKQYTNLARRLKLLTPMFEEIRDSKDPIPEDSTKALASLASTLESAKELLRFGSEGSKIYLVGMAWLHLFYISFRQLLFPLIFSFRSNESLFEVLFVYLFDLFDFCV